MRSWCAHALPAILNDQTLHCFPNRICMAGHFSNDDSRRLHILQIASLRMIGMLLFSSGRKHTAVELFGLYRKHPSPWAPPDLAILLTALFQKDRAQKLKTD